MIACASTGREGEAGFAPAPMMAFGAQPQRDYAASSSARRAVTHRLSRVTADCVAAGERRHGRDNSVETVPMLT
jgi:hypothetical protein